MASASIKASWKVLGVEELIAALQDFKQSVRKRVIYNAVRKCGPVVKAKIRPFVPRETGALKMSIDHRVYTHKSGDGAGVVIGPKKGYSRQAVRSKGRTRAASKSTIASGAKTTRRTPANYAHLVEFGHRIATGGTLRRTDGRTGGVSKSTKYYVEGQYLGRNSRYRRLRKAGVTRMKPFGKRNTGTHGGNVAGALFMTRGWASAQPQLMATIRSSLQAGIRQAAEKAARIGRKR